MAIEIRELPKKKKKNKVGVKLGRKGGTGVDLRSEAADKEKFIDPSEVKELYESEKRQKRKPVKDAKTLDELIDLLEDEDVGDLDYEGQVAISKGKNAAYARRRARERKLSPGTRGRVKGKDTTGI